MLTFEFSQSVRYHSNRRNIYKSSKQAKNIKIAYDHGDNKMSHQENISERGYKVYGNFFRRLI